jgi:hypothetical protein
MKNGKAVLIILVLAAAAALLIFYNQGRSKGVSGGENLFESIDQLSEEFSLPKSNLEWFYASIGLLPKGFLKSSLITSTITGRVVEIDNTPDKVKILSKHYYIGEPGYYNYAGRIMLSTKDGKTHTFFFSPRRVELMKVAEGKIQKSFDDIKVGDTIEVSETIELTRSNINDENLISIDVKILP